MFTLLERHPKKFKVKDLFKNIRFRFRPISHSFHSLFVNFEPRYLLLDEPSLGLAPQIVQQIFSAIETARQELGTTIVLYEQVAALALNVSQQGYVLRRGEVVQSGTAAEISNNPNLSISYLGA